MTAVITLPDWTDDWYPDIDDYNELEVNPVTTALADHNVESVQVDSEWFDDRCPCFNLCVTIAGCKYAISARWLSSTGSRMIYRAEAGNKKALADLKKYLLSY